MKISLPTAIPALFLCLVAVAACTTDAGVAPHQTFNNSNNNGTNNSNNGTNNSNNGNNNATNNATNNPVNNGGGELGIGEACVATDACRSGLICGEAGLCVASGERGLNEPCDITGACQDGLYCSALGICAPAGTAEVGAPCTSPGDCQAGLICLPTGIEAFCAAGGSGDVGEACGSIVECLPGLGCAVPPAGGTEPVCLPATEGGLPTPFTGVSCEGADGELDAPFRMYFEVPTEDGPSEFYRMPHPSDVRLDASGHVDLSRHPRPGPNLVGVDLVSDYLDAIARDQVRYGVNQAMTMRFSGPIDFDSVQTGAPETADDPEQTVFFHNITPASPEYGERQCTRWRASSSQRAYVCQNWITVGPCWGRPMAPNTTYAVIVTDGVKSADGDATTRDDDFAAMLEEIRPGGELGDAWDAYAPLRTYLADPDTPIDAAHVTGAAVFTTGAPWIVAPQLKEAVDQAEAPVESELTLCDSGVTSPCDDGITGEGHIRGCFAAKVGFQEVHGRVRLPIFQQGTAPYLAEGGDIPLLGASVAVQRTEDVCMALTVPDETMPSEGWPVLLVAHGTGGSFRGHADSVAPILTTMEVDGQPVRMLTVGWDQVLHGDRRGGSEQDPELLVFNLLNIAAAKGNYLQAASEVFAMVRWLETLDVSAGDSPTGSEIRINPDQIYFMGHSQGGNSGAIALPFEPAIKAAILSGTGAGLELGLVQKTSPIDSRALLALALSDPDITDAHVILNMLQGYFEEVDSLNYGAGFAYRSIEGSFPKHVLHTLGLEDTYAPPQTLEVMETVMRSGLITPALAPFERGFVPEVTLPASGNRWVDGVQFTVVGRQYAADGDYDGHFVATRNALAQDDIREFLGTAIVHGLPEIKD